MVNKSNINTLFHLWHSVSLHIF